MLKRVLIITYYWPPSGGSGVQRWLKMSKYFSDFGWMPIIYTVDEAEYPVEDLSLLNDVAPEIEVIKRPIVEPYSFYKKFLGIKREQKVKAGFINEGARKKNWKENLAVWVRGNFFIPDARCWWVKPSIRFLGKYLQTKHVDAIISTGPPHSMHLIAMKLHQKTGIPWVADFRDPWTEIDFYNDLKLTHLADCKHHRLERAVLTGASKVVTVGWDCASGLEKHGANDVKVVTNGFDTEDATTETSIYDKFTVSHIGIISSSRNATTLWRVLGDLVATNDDFAEHFELRLIGAIDSSVEKSLIENGLVSNTIRIGQMPHNEVVVEQKKSHVLLLLINNSPNSKGILTGKIFEYLYAHRPILAIGPEDGDTARILKETGAGSIFGFDEYDRIKKEVLRLYAMYKDGSIDSITGTSIDSYSRKNLAGEYTKLLDSLLLETK